MDYKDNVLNKIKYILLQNDVEDNNGVISFYSIIEHAENELSLLRKIVEKNSPLAQKINNYSYINKHLGNFKTSVKTEKIDNTIVSTIVISHNFGDLVFTKDKNSNIIYMNPGYKGREKFLREHLDSISDCFDELESYSEILGSINKNMYCFMYDLNDILTLRIFYNTYGNVYSEINIRKSIEENENHEEEDIKDFINKNKKDLLKKFSFNLNSNLDEYDNNKILLLAKKRYMEEIESKKIKTKKI